MVTLLLVLVHRLGEHFLGASPERCITLVVMVLVSLGAIPGLSEEHVFTAFDCTIVRFLVLLVRVVLLVEVSAETGQVIVTSRSSASL